MSIKRHPALQPFSRDHTIALIHAHQLIWLSEGRARNDANTTISNFQAVWEDEIHPHFKNEESLLPPLPVAANSIERLLAEHGSIIELINELNEQTHTDIELCKTLGQMLVDHIRWEEHELFPEIEKALSEPELDKLYEKTKPIDIARKNRSDA